MVLQEGLAFDDILMVPRFSNIEHRHQVDISNKLGNYKFNLPIISSPMDTICEEEMAIELFHNGRIGNNTSF